MRAWARRKYHKGAAMSQELDLYGSNFDWKSFNWKKLAAVFAVMALIVTVFGFFGHRWLTTTTPVSRDRALQMFQQEAAQADTEAGDKKDKSKDQARAKSEGDKAKSASAATGDNSGSGGGGSSPKNDQTTVAAGTGSNDTQGERSKPAKRAGYKNPTTPDEGVYSWATKGWEEAAGIRRNFPQESQRIITASDGSGFKQHHYFSEEREIWSEFVISKEGAHVAMQRNRAKFGPVTNDSTIDFAPPMQVALANPEEGAAWSGKWQGRTSGSYSARAFDHGTMTIGGEEIEVWAYEYRMQLRGELDGNVYAQVWFAPKYALTVREHYEQTIQSDRGRYRADWTMTLKSTTPQR